MAINSRSSATIDSSLDGKIVWDKGKGEIKIDNSSRAIDSAIDNSTTIQDAIDALEDRGGGTLLFRAGTYTLTSNLTIPSDVSLKGESFGSVNLIFAGAYGITLTGSLAYSTGTISVTKGSAIITGSGTSWLANINPGHKIRINGLPYRLTSVDSDTQITLASEFQGATASGLSYLAAHFVDTVELENLIVVSAGSSGLTATYADLLSLKNVVFSSPAVSGIVLTNCARLTLDTIVVDGANSVGIDMTTTDIVNFNRVNVSNCGSHGVELDTCGIVTFQNSPLSSNGGNGLLITNGYNIGFLLSDASDNTGHGISVAGSATEIQIISSSLNRNTDGLRLAGTVTHATITSSYATGNSGYGINVSVSGVEDTYIVANQLHDNTTGDINDSGTDTVELQTAGGGGATNLSATLSATQTVINSDTGTDATIPAADTTNAGVMTKAMFDKLGTIETNADETDATNVAAAGAVMNTGDETVAGVKTFSSFPVTPSSAPTTNYQVANKKYIDDQIIASGSGDVVGPGSATNSVPALFDGTTGKLIKNSTPTGSGNPVLATSPTITTPTIAQINNSSAPGVKLQLRTQTDNSNSISSATTAGIYIQTGWGQLAGNGTATLEEAVTFPTAFTTLHSVVISFIGATGTDSTAATSIIDIEVGSSTIWASTNAQSASGFNARLGTSGTFAATRFYAYSWVAYGV